MVRPRAVTVRFCMTCRRSRFASEEDRLLVALHRMEHLRADRRRDRWRKQKARKRAEGGRNGALHSLACKGPTHCTCNPIPTYPTRELAEAAA